MRGLYNGTRLANHVTEAKIISRINIENIIYILRMTLSPSQSLLAFKLVGRQFSIIVSFFMTINKSLDYIDLYLLNEFLVTINYMLHTLESKESRDWKCNKVKQTLETTINVILKEVFQKI